MELQLIVQLYGTGRLGEGERIEAGASVDAGEASRKEEGVVSCSTVEDVVACAAVEFVVAIAAEESVVPAPTVKLVASAPARKSVVAALPV